MRQPRRPMLVTVVAAIAMIAFGGPAAASVVIDMPPAPTSDRTTYETRGQEGGEPVDPGRLALNRWAWARTAPIVTSRGCGWGWGWGWGVRTAATWPVCGWGGWGWGGWGGCGWGGWGWGGWSWGRWGGCGWGGWGLGSWSSPIFAGGRWTRVSGGRPPSFRFTLGR